MRPGDSWNPLTRVLEVEWPTSIADPPSNSETIVETLWEIPETLWRCLSYAYSKGWKSTHYPCNGHNYLETKPFLIL
jgi:hypothetical protein